MNRRKFIAGMLASAAAPAVAADPIESLGCFDESNLEIMWSYGEGAFICSYDLESGVWHRWKTLALTQGTPIHGIDRSPTDLWDPNA